MTRSPSPSKFRSWFQPYWIAWFVTVAIALAIFFRFVDPAPPKKIVISTGSSEGEYDEYASAYADLLKDDGLVIEKRKSGGAMENYRRLKDPHSEVEVGFVQDGIGSYDEAPDLVSLGSLYYEPIWIFHRGDRAFSKLSDLNGKRIAIGKEGGGTQTLARKLLKSSGITETNATLIEIGWEDSEKALKEGKVDVAFFLCTPHDALIGRLLHQTGIQLMNLEQAECITRRIPYLHHLTLPRGSMDLYKNIPQSDIHLVAATVTLLIKDSLHPALTYSLLKAAQQIHSEPGIFEKKNEFPSNKDFEFPIADEAVGFYKNGLPFWQKILPYWIATLIDRFILVLIPLFAVSFPVIRLIPRIYQWRMRQKIYRHYGELKYLETQVKESNSPEERKQQLAELDEIENRVNALKLPLDYANHLYSLRGHIDYVRTRLRFSVRS